MRLFIFIILNHFEEIIHGENSINALKQNMKLVFVAFSYINVTFDFFKLPILVMESVIVLSLNRRFIWSLIQSAFNHIMDIFRGWRWFIMIQTVIGINKKFTVKFTCDGLKVFKLQRLNIYSLQYQIYNHGIII